jgi:CubicO group peptidase (beta-lactamase class C family)
MPADALRIQQILRRAITESVAPAIGFAVSRRDNPPGVWYAGQHAPGGDAPACGPHTIFDLASLTKPLTTTAWAMALATADRLDPRAPIGRFVPVVDEALAGCPIWRLMSHTGGLPAHRPYYRGLGPGALNSGRHDVARSALRRMLRATTLGHEPGAQEVYSDLGYLLLEWVCESIDGPLAERWSSLPFHGPDGLHFCPIGAVHEGVEAYAATEACPWRDRLVRGEVHDDNCWTIGGVGGHAGLFGTLSAVHRAGVGWLRAMRSEPNDLGLDPSIVPYWTDRDRMHPYGTRVLGWDTPTPGASTSGRLFGRRAIGHLGFTGTSLWIDPDEEVVMVLLTNRVCPSRENMGIGWLRPILHDAGWRWAEARFT